MWPYKECLTLISLLICRPDEHGQKTRSAATRRWRLSVLTAETLFLVVIRDKCLQSPQSPVLQSCLHLADWHQWQLVYLKQISPPAPPQPRPAQLRPVSYLFSKPTSKLETKLRLISTDLVCSVVDILWCSQNQRQENQWTFGFAGIAELDYYKKRSKVNYLPPPSWLCWTSGWWSSAGGRGGCGSLGFPLSVISVTLIHGLDAIRIYTFWISISSGAKDLQILQQEQ